jgi:uncharacterized protein (DUF1499 family)
MLGLSKRPANLGVTAGRLAPCPSSPNCVSSQADPADTAHFIQPLRYDDPSEIAWARLVRLVSTWPRTRMIEVTDRYLHAEVSTLVLRFVDDLEFLLGPAEIHVRSASRLGRTDFGVNRRRVERLRRAFVTAQNASRRI